MMTPADCPICGTELIRGRTYRYCDRCGRTERQPCLPGAEYVRDLEIALPPVAPLPAPAFELTSPTETPDTQLKFTE